MHGSVAATGVGLINNIVVKQRRGVYELGDQRQLILFVVENVDIYSPR